MCSVNEREREREIGRRKEGSSDDEEGKKVVVKRDFLNEMREKRTEKMALAKLNYFQ